MPAVAIRSLTDQALEVLRRTGNPFRNYFARNPDDDVCARYHVPELFARERDQLLDVVEVYRAAPTTHSEVVPVLGNKGSGKTHLLYSIKHGSDGAWQLLVTPGTYQRDSDFLEYLLFQLIDTLLGGGKQKNVRPIEYVGELLLRQLLRHGSDRTEFGAAARPVPDAGSRSLGAPARPGRLAGPGADAVSHRRPQPSGGGPGRSACGGRASKPASIRSGLATWSASRSSSRRRTTPPV